MRPATTPQSVPRWASGLVALTLTLGCALTAKGTALSPRFFTPETTGKVALAAPSEPASKLAAEAPLELRLGTVEAASYLEERMSYRVSASELGYHDDRLWTERPEEYVRRALATELFERRGVRRVISGSARALDVEVTAFEEQRGKAPQVRVGLRVLLHDDREALLEKSVVVEQPLAPDAGEEHAQRVAEAIGSALDAAVRRVGDDVVRGMSSPRTADAVAHEQE